MFDIGDRVWWYDDMAEKYVPVIIEEIGPRDVYLVSLIDQYFKFLVGGESLTEGDEHD